MQPAHERGYAGLLGLFFAVGIIALLYTYYGRGMLSAIATSSPTTVGGSSLEQDLGALENAKAIQNLTDKRAAEINAVMQ